MNKENFIEKLEVVVPGFLNIFFKKSFWQDQLKVYFKNVNSFNYCSIKQIICLEFVSDNPSGEHSKDKDPYGLDAIKELQKKSSRTMKERFRKKDSFSQFQMQSHVAEKTTSFTQFISVLKEIYTTTLKRFRSLFFNPNPHHPLFSQVTSRSK